MLNFLLSLWPGRIPSNIDPQDEVSVLRERILQSFIFISFFVGVSLFGISLPNYIKTEHWVLIAVYVTCLLALIVITFIRKLPYLVRSITVLVALYLAGFGALLGYGLSGNGPVLLAAAIAVTAIFLGFWPGIGAGILTLLSILGVGLLMSGNLLAAPPTSIQANSTNFLDWASHGLTIALIGVFFIVAVVVLINGLRRALLTQKELTSELTRERDSLEQRIQQRTTDLERRASEIETASQIARDMSQFKDLDELLSKAVELIKEDYHLYYASVFLLDAHKDFAVLRSGTGEAGKAMLSINHRLRLAETSTVGFAILRKQYRLSQEVSQDPIHFKNALLPETQSELAIPLIVGDEVIGALDVQSEKINYFTPDDIRALQISSDQLAVAIEKADLVQQLTKTLDDLRASYRQVTQQSWQGFIKATRRSYSYRYDHGKLEQTDLTSLQADQAVTTGSAIITTISETDDQPLTSVAIPIKLRDQVLGVLDFRLETKKLPSNLVEMLEAAANRLALALENARLLEEIQDRAARDHMVSDISTKVRAESEINKVLQTVAGELGRHLGVSNVLVQLRGNEE